MSLTKFSPTEFQRQCLEGLINLISKSRGELISADRSGVTEAFIEVIFDLQDASRVTAWIYEDECMLTVADKSYHFEKQDFEMADAMLGSFLDLVSSLFRGEEPNLHGSRWIGLFRGRRL